MESNFRKRYLLLLHSNTLQQQLENQYSHLLQFNQCLKCEIEFECNEKFIVNRSISQGLTFMEYPIKQVSPGPVPSQLIIEEEKQKQLSTREIESPTKDIEHTKNRQLNHISTTNSLPFENSTISDSLLMPTPTESNTSNDDIPSSNNFSSAGNYYLPKSIESKSDDKAALTFEEQNKKRQLSDSFVCSKLFDSSKRFRQATPKINFISVSNPANIASSGPRTEKNAISGSENSDTLQQSSSSKPINEQTFKSSSTAIRKEIQKPMKNEISRSIQSNKTISQQFPKLVDSEDDFQDFISEYKMSPRQNSREQVAAISEPTTPKPIFGKMRSILLEDSFKTVSNTADRARTVGRVLPLSNPLEVAVCFPSEDVVKIFNSTGKEFRDQFINKEDLITLATWSQEKLDSVSAGCFILYESAGNNSDTSSSIATINGKNRKIGLILKALKNELGANIIEQVFYVADMSKCRAVRTHGESRCECLQHKSTPDRVQFLQISSGRIDLSPTEVENLELALKHCVDTGALLTKSFILEKLLVLRYLRNEFIKMQVAKVNRK